MKLRLARLWMPLDLILMAPDSTQRFVSVYSLTQGEKKKKKPRETFVSKHVRAEGDLGVILPSSSSHT